MPEGNDGSEFTRETLIEDGLLQAEYQQANQEFRHRDQILHNTFYLLVIALGVLSGLYIRYFSAERPAQSGAIVILTGGILTMIGHLFLKHFHERSSAEVVRMHTEWIANKQRRRSKRALSVEWGVAGGGVKNVNGRLVRRGSYVHYIWGAPSNWVSAEAIGKVLVFGGGMLLSIGIGFGSTASLSSTWGLVLGALSGLVLFIVYRRLLGNSVSPGNEEIY